MAGERRMKRQTRKEQKNWGSKRKNWERKRAKGKKQRPWVERDLDGRKHDRTMMKKKKMVLYVWEKPRRGEN